MGELINTEISRHAVSLQRQLTEFASPEDEGREQILQGLVKFIKEKVNKDVIGLLIEKESPFQPRLESAIASVLETPFEVEGEEVNPWQGGFTIVALDSEGRIRGASSEPTKGLEKYGDLHPYALVKALCSLHLDTFGRPGGLGKLENYEYLKDKLGVPIFTGSTEKPIHIDNYHNLFYLGGSGCSVKEDYLKELLGGATPEHETQAGLYDQIFCELTATYLVEPESPIGTVPEPPDARRVRMHN